MVSLRLVVSGLLLLLACYWPAVVTAHGSGTPQLVNVAAGPYQLWVWSMPDPVRVGDMHISVSVAQPEPVTPLAVHIVLTPADAAFQPIRQQAVRQASLFGDYFEDYYESDFRLTAEGQWSASIQIDGPAGAATAQFPFTVLPPHQINWTIVLWGAMAFAGLLGGLWIRRSAPRG